MFNINTMTNVIGKVLIPDMKKENKNESKIIPRHNQKYLPNPCKEILYMLLKNS